MAGPLGKGTLKGTRELDMGRPLLEGKGNLKGNQEKTPEGTAGSVAPLRRLGQ